MNDEIDVSPYLLALLRRWWIILGTTLGMALLVGVLAWIRTSPILLVPSLSLCRHVHRFHWTVASPVVIRGFSQPLLINERYY
ncbi:hypothetical protein [Chloroflexus sp.]|uniref:hypothetical protein n=1 Tax=Chloroflexus sp. TaxID=1904827 RepID=UPI00404AB5F5